MARINVILECDKCLEEFQKEISRDAKNKFNIKSEINKQSLKEVLEKILVELGE